jgi:peptidoglycan hydrolase CwlO-like protein
MATATITGTTTTTTTCPNCGRSVVSGWRFCESCSAPLAEDARDGAAAARPSAVSQLSASPWVRIGLVAGILAIVIVGAVVMTQRTQHRLDQTKTQLTGTQQQLTATQGQLATTTKARDDLKAQLDAKSAELTAKVSDLAGTKSQLDTFKTCLNGVKRAIDYADAGDIPAADNTIKSVQGACDAVDRLL